MRISNLLSGHVMNIAVALGKLERECVRRAQCVSISHSNLQ